MIATMLILPDAKDLIELVERATPMKTEDFWSWLYERDAKLVFTFTNVREFADSLREADDVLCLRSIVQMLATLPARNLKESTIEVEEIERAITAFNRGTEPERPDPYVARWDQTFAKRGESALAEMIVNYRLDLMVFDLARIPDARRTTRKREALQAIINDRAIPKERRLRPRKSLTAALERKTVFWELEPPTKGFDAFGKWIYANPARCPGFRLAWELFQALVVNDADALQESDVSDNAHFPALPYVDYATLDRRMTGYCRDIGKRLSKLNPSVDYGARVFRNLDELLATVK